ncbi:hypothetical protein ASPZODRAFT_2114135 [Penicilliopsis zonata CBS 506.65]|uniref:Rhodopsin n=1 Tax=Penicilliopsis zonata CBS 506.65 TaxID=1073090 RepID=A0A1L9S8U2_9EURO|nr:hypothetical protein ASPZODRAFT_2114135 [Penicilliopsis zonata CBS 506.65]OJJ43581.1 hypothetical protein ASPZODRAFT_2114135 [Penicilliopsis zonata CBS 506.65]
MDTLSSHGSDFLWAVTGIYVVSFLGLLTLSFTAKESDRVFHYLFSFILLLGASTYYAQAANLGWMTVTDEQVSRQVFYAKYINWAVSFPSLALAFGLLAGVSWTTMICNIAMAVYWVGTYLVAAYTSSVHKWGLFAFGTFAWLILAMSTLNESREAAALLGVERDYLFLSVWLNLLWVLYPVAFALTDATHRIGVTGGAVFFGVLDILTVPVLALAFVLVFSRRWDYRKLSLAFSDSRPSRESRE